MASSRGGSSNQAKLARTTSTRDFDSSNATSNAFLGGKQKEWMSCNPNASFPPSLAPPKRTAVEPQLTAEQTKTLKSNDFSILPFPPGYDRGRFPRERRRRGGTKHSTTRLTPFVASSSKPIGPGSPMDSGHLPVTNLMQTNIGANNSLPSPSPSIETRRHSATVIDHDHLENESPQGQVDETLNAGSTDFDKLFAKYGYEELKRRFAEMEKPTSVPTQHEASTNPLLNPVTSDHTPSAPVSDGTTQPITETNLIVNNYQRSSSANNKKRSEAVSERCEPRQSVPQNFLISPEQVTPGVNQTASSPSATVEAEMQSFNRKALQRLHCTNVPDRPGIDYERPRISLLRNACENSDFFYLRLHQLFCVDAMYRRIGRVAPFLEASHRSGLEVLSYLLVANEQLSADAIEWFSNFPLPWDVLHASRPAFHSANLMVLNCLAKLSNKWDFLRRQCRARDYPPLVDELIVMLEVESFTFHRIIFLALLREIWKGPQDACYQLTEEVFPHNYRGTMLRRLRNNSKDAHKAYNAFVVSEYQRIALDHRHHMQQQTYQGVMLSQQQRQATKSLQQGTHSAPTHASMPAVPSPAATSHRHPSIVPAPPRGDTSLHHNLAVNTDRSLRGTFSAQSRIPTQDSQGLSIPFGYHLPHQPQYQQGQNIAYTPTIPVSSNTMPSTRSVDALHVLPSNVSNRGASYSQQRSDSQALQPPQLPPPYAEAHSSFQTGPQCEAQRQNFEKSQESYAPQTLQQKSTQFIHAHPNLNQVQANPTRIALHQAHVRSPTILSTTLEGKPINTKKTFRFIKHVIMPPGQISSERRFLKWDFNIEKALADTLARDTPGSYGSPSNRTLFPGSRTCRIRCIKVDKSCDMPSQHEWVASDSVWPSNTAIILNDTALEIRKKSHHGKDLPIDATPYIKEGLNSISTAVIGFSDNSVICYAIGVEIIEVIEEPLIKSSILGLPWQVACKRMTDRFKNLDPEVMVVNSHLIVDLKDPFSAQMFTVPVRGICCKHDQCFDRDIFLETRNSKGTKEPCGPDEFRCPICGSDARPHNLIVDGFLVQVREDLQKKGRLDAKAIVLYPSGSWDIKEEEEVTGEQGDGSGRRNAQQARPSTARQSAAPEVIEIDD